jgi:hypothetical protein
MSRSQINTGRLPPHNKALQPTANPLRDLSAAELGRYALDKIGKIRFQ